MPFFPIPFYRRFVLGNTRDALRIGEQTYRERGWDLVWTPTRERPGSRSTVPELVRIFGTHVPRAVAVKLSVVSYPDLLHLWRASRGAPMDVWIDAEDDDRYHRDLRRTYAMMRRFHAHLGARSNFRLCTTIQAFRRDAVSVLEAHLDRSAREGIGMGIKLVRGAYARRPGTHWTTQAETDRAYDACMDRLFSMSQLERPVWAVYATHNRTSIERVLDMAPQRTGPVSISQLRGFERTTWVPEAKRLGVQCQLLVPFGSFQDSLPYLVRRARENAAMWKHLW